MGEPTVYILLGYVSPTQQMKPLLIQTGNLREESICLFRGAAETQLRNPRWVVGLWNLPYLQEALRGDG